MAEGSSEDFELASIGTGKLAGATAAELVGSTSMALLKFDAGSATAALTAANGTSAVTAEVTSEVTVEVGAEVVVGPN
jgi:hypothetical protein